MTDERQRLAKTYSDLEGAELLELYRKREDLSEIAVEILRDELKVRGIDPDSLEATVPKAIPADEGEPEGTGEGEDVDSAPELPEELQGEFDPGNMIPCPSCGSPNHRDEERCRGCHASLAAASSFPEAAADTAAPIAPGAAPGSIASASFGLMGISGLVFALYIAADQSSRPFAYIAGAVGLASLGLAIVLFRRPS